MMLRLENFSVVELRLEQEVRSLMETVWEVLLLVRHTLIFYANLWIFFVLHRRDVLMKSASHSHTTFSRL